MTEFIMDNYIWILIVLGIALMACVGYMVDKRENKKKKKKVEKVETSNIPVTEEVPINPIPQTESIAPLVAEEPIVVDQGQISEPEVHETIPVTPEEYQTETFEPIDEQFKEIGGYESFEPQENVINPVEMSAEQPMTYEEPIQPIMEESQFQPLESDASVLTTEYTPISAQVETNVALDNNQSEQPTLEPIGEVELVSGQEEATPTNFFNTELPLQNDNSMIDREFQNILSDSEQLQVEMPPIEEEKKDEFKTLDDDEDLWKF